MNAHRTTMCCMAIAIGFVLLAVDAGGGGDQERPGIIDDWTQIYEEYGGEKFPTVEAARTLYTKGIEGGDSIEYKPHVWKITKDSIEHGRGNKESPIVKYRYERDMGGKTGTIDFVLVEKDAKKEKRKLGLYFQVDDFLMIAWNPPGDDPPTSLMTQPKSKTTMVILRRGIIK